MNNIPENEEILRPSLSHLPDSYGQWLLSESVDIVLWGWVQEDVLFSY